MIIGTGSDLVDIERVEGVLDRHGDRFTQRCFTPAEIARAERRRDFAGQAATYAKRFAAKEACAKALGTGIDKGIYLKDIGVENDESGRPALVLTGGAKQRLTALTPPGKTARLHLSLTDEPPLAQAFVIIEAV
jgi:holo-[acyl-carrier protein] synthase